MAELQSDLVNLGGLWKTTSANGNDYLSGSFGNAKIMVFKNDKKDNDRAPDYRMVMANKQRPEEGAEGSQASPPPSSSAF